MSEVLKRGLPVLQRFAGLGKYLPKGAIRNNAYAAALFTPLDVAGNFMEGKNPIRAVGRPLFQLGGGIGGGMLGGALGIPSGPGLAATAVAGGTGGYYGGGSGGSNDTSGSSSQGAGTGALRLMWPGDERAYPSTRVADE